MYNLIIYPILYVLYNYLYINKYLKMYILIRNKIFDSLDRLNLINNA